MPTIPVSPRFNKCRMRILADGGSLFGNLVTHFAKVHAIRDRRGNVVAFRAINNFLERS